MSYENFITKLLNIKPSELLSVMSSSAKDGSIILKVRLKPKECYCHICNIPGKTHGYYQRKLTHSTLVNRQCIIIYEQRRYKCPECGSTFSERNPFIDTSERVTYETKINVLKDLKQPENTYTSIAKKYNLSATKVTRIFDKHVNIKRKPLPMVLSIDEHYFPSSDYGTKYCCLFMNFQTGVMIDIIYERLRLARNTEDQTLKYLLVKFRSIFDHNKNIDNEPRYNKRLNRYVNLRDIRDIVFNAFEELRAAYELKEYYIRLNAETKLEEAPRVIDEAIEYFESCGIEEYEEFYKMLINWREEIINSFTLINGKRINNSYMESKNRVLSRLIFNANGFKNFERTRNRMLYCLNPDDTFRL